MSTPTAPRDIPLPYWVLAKEMGDSQRDELAVTVSNVLRIPSLAAVEFPLAVKPTQEGLDAGVALVGGIEVLSQVTADEVC